MSHYSDYTDFDNFVNDPVSSAYYISPTNDVGSNSNLRVYDSQSATLGPGQSGAAASLQFAIDTWLSGASDPASYTNWSTAYATFRYLNGRLTYSGIAAGDVSYVTDFKIFADVAPTVQQSGTLTVLAGGTTLTFPNTYHTAPYVTATVASVNQILPASCEAPTATDVVIHVWDHSGADVGGQIFWTSNGT